MLPSGELQFVGQFNSDMAMLLPRWLRRIVLLLELSRN